MAALNSGSVPPVNSPSLIVRGARVIDPAQKLDRVTDIAVEQGKIVGIGDYSALAGAEYGHWTPDESG